MPKDIPRFEDDPEDDSPRPAPRRGDEDGVPASFEFMEMIRQVARKPGDEEAPSVPTRPFPPAPSAPPREPEAPRPMPVTPPVSAPPGETTKPPLEPFKIPPPPIPAPDADPSTLPGFLFQRPGPAVADEDDIDLDDFLEDEDEDAYSDDGLIDEISAGIDADRAAQRARVKEQKRRRRRQRAGNTIGTAAGIVRTMLITVVAAILTATIFTWFTPSEFIDPDLRQSLSAAIATDSAAFVPTSQPTPNWARRIGIVSGHRGPQNDPGAVCPDGLTEAEINFNVATMVVAALQGRGYTVDLLDEFDPRLDDYQATALLSIHANTCQDYGERVSGFLISTAAARAGAMGNDDVLVNCVAQHYAVASGLERRMGLTVDMTDYHTFREIHRATPAAILELGFMLADRDIMVNRPDVLATGITDGILCFLEPSAAPPPADAGLPAGSSS
ncbi:MAG: N-acetylmuramoyl-L-alanine amidase [Pleurocapsa minor GSE-CHR-MK-17-07R]|jgi:N-acetylmuramoyl-L-alanine amidase|nr:N-acetylmuramoyl-L-alanine amidase [Pleurocapsa minor GSE-CHR-MK 17-07R]